MIQPSITIAIPTLNGLPWLKESVPMFFNQEYTGEIKVVTIDSGSVDGTQEFLLSMGAEVYPLQTTPFNHGQSRNELLQFINTDLVLYTVQDAAPRSKQWLNDMVQSLVESQCDAICGGQCVQEKPNTNPIQWYRPVHEPRTIRKYTGSDYAASDLSRKETLCRWDNVNALYKTDLLNRIPFPCVEFGEDMAWAKTALEKETTIGFCDHGKVHHYHHETPEFVRQRVIATASRRHKLFQTQPRPIRKPNLLWALRKTWTLVARCKIWSPKQIVFWIHYNWINRNALFSAIEEVLESISEGELDKLNDSLVQKGAPAPNSQSTR